MAVQEENDDAAEEDPDMEGELTSADVRKLQSLVDEQEQAVQAGRYSEAVYALHKSAQPQQLLQLERFGYIGCMCYHAWLPAVLPHARVGIAILTES